MGAQGYTISPACHAEWMPNSNIRIEIVCDEATAEALIGHLSAHYYEHYAMIVLSSDIVELRPEPK